MSEMTAVGLHLAKNAFQANEIDAEDTIIARRPLRRGDMLKFFEACPRAWWDGRLAERPTLAPGDSSAGACGEPNAVSLRQTLRPHGLKLANC
jgi:hypothetical protein